MCTAAAYKTKISILEEHSITNFHMEMRLR